jgi:cytochrome c peroxidase
MDAVPTPVGFALVLASWLFAVLPAQDRQPRFVLPEVPYDYAPVLAPGLGALFPFLERNEPPPVERDRRNAIAALGRVLFYEPKLSRNGSRSCASCHQQARGLADGTARSRGFHGRPTRRNAMAIVNLGLREGGFFWDARASSLEQMVLMPIEDPIEMGLRLDELAVRLRADPGYPPLFERAFGDARIDIVRVAAALAGFVRSIASFRSRYDEGLAAAGRIDADFPNFTPAENRGKRLFFGAGSCAVCHAASPAGCGASTDPLLSPYSSLRNNGLDRGRAGDDPGRAGVTGEPSDLGRFRNPSLRNIELTAPYMHDGRLATLEQVVQFYSDRVREHPNLDARLRRPRGTDVAARSPTGDGAWRSLSSTAVGTLMASRQRADLVAFLKTLTDWPLVRDPRFADPFVR